MNMEEEKRNGSGEAGAREGGGKGMQKKHVAR